MYIGLAPKLLLSKIIVDSDLDLTGYSLTPGSLVCDANAAAGDTLLKSDDAIVNTTSISYVVKKSITVPAGYTRDNEFRIKFSIRCDTSGYNVMGKIYVNGLAVGTQRTTTSNSYVEFSEDITDIQSGDNVELYLSVANAGRTCYAQNFRIYGDLAAVVPVEVPTW